MSSSAPETARTESAKGSVEVVEPTKLEQAVARRVAESKATIPHVYLDAEIEVTRALGAAEAAGAALRDVVIRAAATALREFTRVNGAYRDGRFELYSRVNVGIAVTGEAGPSVPTLFDADSMTVAEIAAESRRLEDAARAGSLTAPQLAGGTFTFTDLSATAVTSYEPVIHGGQAGALALGGVADSAVIRDGQVAAGRLARAALACDNRIVDGAIAAAFLTRMRELVEAADG